MTIVRLTRRRSARTRKERVGCRLDADCRDGPMTRIHHRILRQRDNSIERRRKVPRVRHGQVGSPDGSGEQAIPDECDPVAVEHDVARRMTWRVHHGHAEPGDLEDVTVA